MSDFETETLKWTFTHGTGIQIVGDEKFVLRVCSAWLDIGLTDTGRLLFDNISKSKKKVIIAKQSDRPSLTNTTPRRHSPDAILRGKRWESWEAQGNGRDSDSQILINFDFALPNEAWFRNCPDGIILAHEILHARLFAYGEYDPDIQNRILNGRMHYRVPNGELQVIGLPPFEDLSFTENQIRSEWTPCQLRVWPEMN